MVHIINLLIIFWLVGTANAFIICGAYIAANHKDDQGRGMILSGVNAWIKARLGLYWSKPFLHCYKCMGSVWGGIPLIAGMYALPVISPTTASILPWWYYVLPLPLGVSYAFFLAFYSTILYNMMNWFCKGTMVVKTEKPFEVKFHED